MDTLIKTYCGSISYGTNTKNSDTDIIEILMPSLDELLNEYFLNKKQDSKSTIKNGVDTLHIPLQHFLHLTLQNNPSKLEILFVRENHVIEINQAGKDLLSLASDFLSKKIYKTFGGYAIGQLHRMIKSPSSSFEDNRGKRLEEYASIGYNAKHAMHCVRLLRMGAEALLTGELEVFRHDRVELLDIKNGLWSFDKICEEVEFRRRLLDEAFVKSELPPTPNVKKILNWAKDVYH